MEEQRRRDEIRWRERESCALAVHDSKNPLEGFESHAGTHAEFGVFDWAGLVFAISNFPVSLDRL